MLSRPLIRVFSLMVAMLLCFGCTSGRNEATPASASPTPTQGPQQAASHAPPRTTGHTEAHGGGGVNTDESEHCFQQDDTRDLVLTFTSDGDLTNSTVSAFIINLQNGNAPIVVEDIPTITRDPKDPTTVNIRFSDSLLPGARGHLGPGPYMAVTTVDPTGGTGLASAGPKLRTGDVYRYSTVPNAKTDCPH